MILAVVKSLFSRSKGTDEGVEKTPTSEDLQDQELMVRYAKGDQAAFAILVKRHQQGLYHYLLRSVRSQAVAEELLQEVFLRVVKAADTYEPTAKFTTWLYRIARNIAIDHSRKSGKAKVLSLQNQVGTDEGGETHQDLLVDENAQAGDINSDRKAFRDALQQALDTLPEEQREVFLLREVTGLKFREIADVLSIGVPTVKSRMRYALKALQGELSRYRDHSFDEDEEKEMVP